MPLSTFQLRNEYGLGVRELYSESSKREDSKAVLDGVAVAGVVGLLRQLGDLSEFAAEIFHGLQEQMASTASRSRKLMTRVKRVEAALPPLEKAMLSQTSHLHFAYTPGSEWHAHIRNEQNHFIYSDLPSCIMDSYEECKEPPRLQLLDRFDAGGPGSCLKRYSDPTFFRRASGNSNMLNDLKSKKERKARKSKKRRSWKQSSQLSNDASNFYFSGRLQFSSPSRQRQSSPTQSMSTVDVTFKSDFVDQSDSLGSGDGMGFIECAFHPYALVQTDETKSKPSLSGSGDKPLNNLESKYPEEQTLVVYDGNPRSSTPEKNSCSSSGVAWDEKVEIVEPMVKNPGMQKILSSHESSFEFGSQEMKSVVWKSGDDDAREVSEGTFQLDEPDIEPKGWNSRSYVVPEVQVTNFEVNDVEAEPNQISGSNKVAEVHEKSFEFDVREMESLGQTSGGHKKTQVHETNLEQYEQEIEPKIDGSLNRGCTSFEGVDSPNLALDKNQPDEIESETDNFVDALNTIETESENELDCQTKGETKLSSHLKDDLEDDVNNERIAGNIVDHSLVSEAPCTSYNHLDNQKFSSLHGSTSSLLPACEESLPLTSACCDISGGEPHKSPENLASFVHSVKDKAFPGKLSSSIHNVSSGNDFSVHDDNANGSKQEPATGEFSSSEFEPTSMMAGMDMGCIRSSYVSEHPSIKPSNVGSIALWTNGSLLGLQPSKPPDFSTSNSVHTNNGITDGPLYQKLWPNDDHPQAKLDSSNKTLFSDNNEDSSKKPPLQFSNFGLDKKLNNSVDSALRNSSADSQSHLLPSVKRPEAKPHGAADVSDAFNEAIHVNEEKSSLFGLGHGSLINGFPESRSMGYDEKPKAVGFQNTHDLENSPHVTLHRSSSVVNLTEEPSSPLNSSPPSPPIEHMKISFQPINNSETSKLKLKYPEGIDYHDETLEAFPSFQLVPKPTLQQVLDVDSDDDTFCRSNRCMSDDDLSHLSDSNSELWESGDSSESKDHILHNGLSRISSGESISSLADHEQTTNRSINNGDGSSNVQDEKGVACTSSSNFPNIPLLQAMNPFDLQETKISYSPKVPMEPFDLQEITPEPPPLPPLQWRVLKPRSDASEGKESTMDFISSFSVSTNPQSVNPHRAKLAVDELINNGNEHKNVSTRMKHFDEQKFKVNIQEQTSQSSKERGVDEREDFLHQIRAKSFNLRKTGLLKPTPAPAAPATHDKLTAILKKANAIRQAVASDDGEDDDPWSDT